MDLEPQAGVTPIERRQRAALSVLTVLLVLLGLYVIASFIPALLWASIIAIAIRPLYRRAAGRWPRLAGGATLPAIATLAIGLLVLVPLGYGLVRAVGEAHDLLTWLANARQQGIPEPAWVAELPFGRASVSAWWAQHLATPEGANEQLRQGIEIARTKLVGSSLAHRAITFLFTLLALFFLLRDGDEVAAQMRRASDRLFGPAGERLGIQMIRSVRGTIDGLVLVGLGEGAVMAIVYLIAGVPHPILLGLLTAVAAMIPFGAAVLFAIASLLLVAAGSLIGAIVVFAIGMGVVAVADHLVRPVLIGGATKLPFLWVLIGILGGVEAFGLLGLFVGPVAIAVLMQLWRDLVHGALPPPERVPPEAPSSLSDA